MSLSARVFEGVNHVLYAMRVRSATWRNQIRAIARGQTSHVVPVPERLEDRLLLSNTLIDSLKVAEGETATFLDSGAASLLANDIGFEADGFEAVIDPDEVGWASVRNLTKIEFEQDFATRKVDHLLIDIEVNEIDGQQIMSGVWQQNTDDRLWNAHHNLTHSQFGAQWTMNRDAGYRLIDQESYVLGGQRYYAGIWIQNLEGYEWGSYRNATSSGFSHLFEDYKDNHIPIDFDAYTYGGSSTRYAAAWVENNDALQWILRYDLTTTEFASEFSTNKDLYRVHDVESYQVGGQQRYAAIWIENSNGREWAEFRDMNAQDYRNRWLRYRDLGYRLTDFEQYAAGDGIRYAGVWRQNTDRPDWYLRPAIDAMAEEHLDDEDIPGMSVAIVSQGQIKYMRGFGHQDVADDVWYSAHTINRLASVSKAIAGVLLYKLDGQDEIDASSLTSAYVDELPTHHTHTLSQLASNRSGVDHYLPSGDPDRLLPHYTQYDTALEASQLFWDRALVCNPGTCHQYSTHGYTLLGAAIEGATNQAVDDVLYAELGSGLGLTTLQAEDRSVANEFRTMLYNTDNTEATADNISWKLLGGGMEASAYDLARFSDMLMAGQILSDVSLSQLWTVPTPSNLKSYAMGWTVGTQQDHFSVRKDGVQLGADTYVRLFPELDLGIVVLSNRRSSSSGDLSSDIANAILTGTPSVGGYVELNPMGDATVANTLTNSADTDVFAFAIDNVGNTSLDVDDHAGVLDAGLRLWDLEDDVIVAVDSDSVGDDPQLNESLSSWNLYAAEIFSEHSSGAFTLSIDGPAPVVSVLSLDADGDELRAASIAGWGTGNDVDYFSFVAPSTTTGDLAMTLTPEAGSGLNGVLTLYDSAGVQLLRANSGGSEVAETINYTGAVGGETYFARVGAYIYGSDGNYELDIDFDLPLPTIWSDDVEGFATMYQDGVSRDVLDLDAAIDFPGDIDSYYFASDTEGTVTIDVDDFANKVDPIVAIYNAATGELLGWDDDSGGGDNAQVSLDISRNTRYIVAVADANGTETGDLGITIATPMEWAGENIWIGIDGTGTTADPYMNNSADSDFLRFTTPSNTIGTGSVTVIPSATLNVEFVMFDAAGNELERGNSSGTGDPSILSYNGFAPDTEYYLTIHSNDYETDGDVTLVEVNLDLYGEIRGTKFYDRDRDGNRDPGEESLPGWTIYLDENNNGVPDPGEPITVTDENGEYAFTNLEAGGHVVREILKAGWTQTTPGAASTLLYNVDFDTPPHTVLDIPATGAGAAPRETISSIVFGTPLVVGSAGPLNDQPLYFYTPNLGTLEQVQLDLNDFGQTFDHYAINMDLLVLALDPGSDVFSVFIDAPAFRKVVFYGDGTIEEHVAGSPATQIGNYVKGDVLALRIDVDLVAAIWTITLDGTVLHSDGFQETNIEELRLSLSDPGGSSASVAVDNITIHGRDFGSTVPNALANTDGNLNNLYPFLSGTGEMRYQQIYDASQFASGGTIDQIRFRPDAGPDSVGSAFDGIDIDLQINLGYAATTIGTASTDFADNIGSGYTTVHDGILTLSSNNFGSLPAFDVSLDVDDLFHYDPTQGDLLLDIVKRSQNNWDFSSLDYTGAPENLVTNRIYSTDLDAESGMVSNNFGGLVTYFVFTDLAHTITLGSGEVATADFGNHRPGGGPPVVTEFLVRGGDWTDEFLDHLAVTGQGVGGYSIPVGSQFQLRTLPWEDIELLIVRFSEVVEIDLGDFNLQGELGPDGNIFTDDAWGFDTLHTEIGPTGEFQAVLSLSQPLVPDFLQLIVDDTVEDPAGNPLDGDWEDMLSTYPSGDGDDGGRFAFEFRTNLADITGDGTVAANDLSRLLRGLGSSIGSTRYSARIDFDADGSIAANDLSTLLSRLGTGLPEIILEPDGDAMASSSTDAEPVTEDAEPGPSTWRGREVESSLPVEVDMLVPSAFSPHARQLVNHVVKIWSDGSTRRVCNLRPLPLDHPFTIQPDRSLEELLGADRDRSGLADADEFVAIL